MTVFRTSEIGGRLPRGRIERSVPLSLGERANRLLCRRSEKYPITNRGAHIHEMYSNRGAHIHEMYSKPLIRKGLRLVGYTEVIETLVGEGI